VSLSISPRYTYDTCYTKQRCGAQACGADRIPADQLHDAIFAAMLDLFASTGIFEDAIAATAATRDAGRADVEAELEAIEEKITAATAATAGIDRYLAAFEAGDLPQRSAGSACKPSPRPQMPYAPAATNCTTNWKQHSPTPPPQTTSPTSRRAFTRPSSTVTTPSGGGSSSSWSMRSVSKAARRSCPVGGCQNREPSTSSRKFAR
jgi:hypothetical protein